MNIHCGTAAGTLAARISVVPRRMSEEKGGERGE